MYICNGYGIMRQEMLLLIYLQTQTQHSIDTGSYKHNNNHYYVCADESHCVYSRSMHGDVEHPNSICQEHTTPLPTGTKEGVLT
jgi:hypothetical protein